VVRKFAATMPGAVLKPSDTTAIFEAVSQILPVERDMVGTVWNALGKDRRNFAVWAPKQPIYGGIKLAMASVAVP
jgi:hypothetical protein